MPYPNSFYAFRPYALELAKYFKKFLYTQAMMDYVKEIKTQGRNLTDKEKSIYGVQFHPESFLSEYGLEMIANFLRIVDEFTKN